MIYSFGDMKLTTVSDDYYITPNAILIGAINLGNKSSIWWNAVIRADNEPITIGDNTNIQDSCVLHTDPGFPIKIGANVSIGHKCMLHGCTLGNRILVGMGAIVMDGAIVEDDVFIGAGTLVPPNKRLESGYLYVGNPMIQKRPLKEAEMAFLKQSAINYVELKDDYLAEGA